MTEPCKIPLRNNKGEIVDHALVDAEDFVEVNKYKWHLTKNGYVESKIDSRNVPLHQNIMGKASKTMLIDHINGNKLDNTRTNLRFASRHQNGQNKPKKTGTSSTYIGIGYCKKIKKWIAMSRYNGQKKNLGSFLEPIHAAEQYDKFVLLHFGENARTNNLINFEDVKDLDIETLFFKTKKEIPKNIVLNKKLYEVLKKYKGNRFYKTTTTLDEAISVLKEFEKKIEEIKTEELNLHYQKEITRNKDGVAIIEVKTSTEENDYFMVSDNLWHDISRYTWTKENTYYITRIKNMNIKVHRMIMNANDDDIIDHSDKNTRNNTTENLRLSTDSFNNHNRTKVSGASSTYLGVTKKTNTDIWIAQITKDHKHYYIGSFYEEIEAAKAYNKRAIELYGEYANLNVFEN